MKKAMAEKHSIHQESIPEKSFKKVARFRGWGWEKDLSALVHHLEPPMAVRVEAANWSGVERRSKK